MAYYIRFEIYLPVIYSIVTTEGSGTERRQVQSLDYNLVQQLITETVAKFGGITQANPIGPVPLKGFWQETASQRIEVDRLTYLFGLARADQEDEALRHFSEWKKRFEASADQSVVLVVYYPVQTIGDLLT